MRNIGQFFAAIAAITIAVLIFAGIGALAMIVKAAELAFALLFVAILIFVLFAATIKELLDARNKSQSADSEN